MELRIISHHLVLALMMAVLELIQHRSVTFAITVNNQHSECLYTHYGTAYDGNISVTQSGKTCQSWSSQNPHPHPHTDPSKFPDGSLTDASNFCRNPSGVRDRGVWCYTTDTNTEWEYCEVPYCECKIHRSGHGYLGSHSATYTGVTCQRWDSQTPHAHSYVAEDFDDFTLADANNYCRNPDPGWHWGTFCYTSSPQIRVQHCSINFCECKTTMAGDKYEGYLSVTVSGKACQAWSSQTPHAHGFNHISMFPDTRMEAAADYCRNPDDNHSDGPWCYTTDPNTRWEPCDIPKCEYLQPESQTTTTTTPAPQTPAYTGPTISERSVEENISQPIQECKFTHKGSSYRGSISVTVTGKTCQAWDSQTPHPHPTIPGDSLPEVVTKSSNKCRNPTLSEFGPWCFTDTTDTRFEYCDIPLCNCKTSRSGASYQGYARKTRSGLTCQAWRTQSPHRHEYSDSSFPMDDSKNAAENYCRNPENDDPNGPWCFTTDPNVRWEYCGVPYCECKEDVKGTKYQGTISVTKSGRRCQRWDSQSPHAHNRNDPSGFPAGTVQAAHNYCRNPDLEPRGPWCYTTDPEKRWEYCDIPLCELEPETIVDLQGLGGDDDQDINSRFLNCKLSKTGESYQGTISHTETYRACQRWEAQTPHPQPYTDVGVFPDNSLQDAGDYCRNPGRSRERPWCYTLDPKVEWEYCPVPDCGCKNNKGGWTYNGTKTVTKNGFTCQRWDSQAPHKHSYHKVAKYFPDETLADAANYCRNPQLWEPDGPWCYTTNPNVRWDYCDIPFCECKTTEAGHEYGGKISKTKTGLTCQRWDSQAPHQHSYHDRCMFVDDTVADANNYCRNNDPNELHGPYCYTTDPHKRWQYCDIPMCDNAGQHPLVTEHGEGLIRAEAERIIANKQQPSQASPAVISLSILLVLLLLVLFLIALYNRRSFATWAVIAKEKLATKSFDNPLYGETPATAAFGSGSTSVKLEVPDITTNDNQPTKAS